MRDEQLQNRIRRALDAEMSGLQVSSLQRDRLFENTIGGKKMKRKLTVGLALAIVLTLVTMAALAVTLALLTPQEVVEQKAVPMAQGNDSDWRVVTDFSPGDLAAFIGALSENGFTLDENSQIMEAFRNGEGYDEEEAIMAVCRQAFGGVYGEWTLAQRHWFWDMMVQIGWAAENQEVLPGPDDLTEEDAKARMLAAVRAEYGADLPLEDRTQFETGIDFEPEAGPGDAVWTLRCEPRDRRTGTAYYAALNKAGETVHLTAVPMGNPGAPGADPEPEALFSLTEDEAKHLAAEAIREQYGTDTPLEDPTAYRWFVNRSRSGEAFWHINFISLTADGGFCSTEVKDATGEVTIHSADVGGITADNILARYRAVNGWYDTWDSTVWSEIARRAADLPEPLTMEGRVVKATPWIAWRGGLLTRAEAEEQAFRQAGVRMGEMNCASLIDAAPHPIWKFRLLPWDGTYQDSIVVEIDAVTGEMTDLDMYKSDYGELEPSFHMVTLHRIWAKLELAENGPLYLARLAILHRFADMSFDMPEVDDLPVFDQRYWKPEISGNTVRLRSLWADDPDYEAELDENGVAVRVEKLPSSGTEDMPMYLDRECLDESLYGVNPHALAAAQEAYGINDALWPLEVQMSVFTDDDRSLPREGEMTLEEAIAFARDQLPPEAEEYAKNAVVGARFWRIDEGEADEYTRWGICFFRDPDRPDFAWRVTFADKRPDTMGPCVDVKEPGDNSNG